MPFDHQPTLEGDLLRLRPLTAEDHEDLYSVAADPLLWEQHPAPRNERHVFDAFFQEALACGGTLVVEDRATGRVIGSSRYHGHSEEWREVEIGWTFLARAYWGGVYNGEMKRLMLEHAYRFVDHVVFLVAPDNIRSQRAVLKIGGVRDGSRRDAYGRESHLYRISAESAAVGK